jgi:hypothetical protein
LITVQTQPSGLICVVANSSGAIVQGAVTNIAVTCGQWIWQAGSNAIDAAAVYGTKGVAAAGNIPGSRAAGGSWRDAVGNFWLFGGTGYDGIGMRQAGLGDLWSYSPATGLWTWVTGPMTGGGAGVYGTQGVAAATNVPGGRTNLVTWIDDTGALWLFGGYGYDSIGLFGELNDLWKYDPGTTQWTWMGGSNKANAVGIYGTKGQPAAGNIPSSRDSAVAWTDQSGNFWLFGGNGTLGSPNVVGYENDLWEYSPATGMWTWVSGESTGDSPSVYGTRGIASAANVPGARLGSSAWIDGAGTLWLFGGYGASPTPGFVGLLNDLWNYKPSTGMWTWVSGSNVVMSPPGVYGTLGTPAGNVAPGAREYATSWIDKSGALWLLGGGGRDKIGNGGGLNDLWRFDQSTGLWTWVSGSDTASPPGVYGTKGQPGPGNTPGGRYAPFAWSDSSDNIWMFGGFGVVTSPNYFNDLWEYAR